MGDLLSWKAGLDVLEFLPDIERVLTKVSPDERKSVVHALASYILPKNHFTIREWKKQVAEACMLVNKCEGEITGASACSILRSLEEQRAEHMEAFQTMRSVHEARKDGADVDAAQLVGYAQASIVTQAKGWLKNTFRIMSQIARAYYGITEADREAYQLGKVNPRMRQLRIEYYQKNKQTMPQEEELRYRTAMMAQIVNPGWWCRAPVRLVDIGSCHHPFRDNPDFDVCPLDLQAGHPEVLQCDFLSIPLGDALSVDRMEAPAAETTVASAKPQEARAGEIAEALVKRMEMQAVETLEASAMEIIEASGVETIEASAMDIIEASVGTKTRASTSSSGPSDEAPELVSKGATAEMRIPQLTNTRRKTAKTLPRSHFHVAVMSLMLSYVPSGSLRVHAVRKARDILLPHGLLIISEAPSTFGKQSADLRKLWTRGIEAIGFQEHTPWEFHFGRVWISSFIRAEDDPRGGSDTLVDMIGPHEEESSSIGHPRHDDPSIHELGHWQYSADIDISLPLSCEL